MVMLINTVIYKYLCNEERELLITNILLYNHLKNNIMKNLESTSGATLNFADDKIQNVSFETLKRTKVENNTINEPVMGIYHFVLIQKILDICQKYQLNFELENIFAAQNQNKANPGVTLDPRVEDIYGKNAVEAHVLRRIYTTINIKNWETDELTTTIAIAFHQDGIQVAIGPNVKICHNQCILHASRSVSSYGRNKLTISQIFDCVDNWMSNFEEQMNEDRERIRRLKSTPLTTKDLYALIGLLTVIRVKHDSKEKELSSQVDNYYPLNQGQISVFTEDLLKLEHRKQSLTAWDVYNVATDLYKPGKSDFRGIIPQNCAMVEMLYNYSVKFG